MTRSLIFILPLFILVGCASTKQSTDNVKPDHAYAVDSTQAIKKALDPFVNGLTLEMKGDFAGAVLEFQDALIADPKPGIYHAIAKNYLYLNKLALALQNSRKAVELEPGNVEFNYLLAQIYINGKVSDSAEIVLNRIISIDSSEVQAYYKLAQISETSRPLKSIEIYNRLTKIIGADWNVLLRITELYERLGNIDAAIKSIEELLAMDPSNQPIQKLLVDFYVKGKYYDKALEQVNDIITQNHGDLELREKKAQIYIEQNKWVEAGKEYEYILEQPDVPLEAKTAIGAAYFERSLKDSSLIPMTKNFFVKLDKDTAEWVIKIHLATIASIEQDSVLAAKYLSAADTLNGWRLELWIKLCGNLFDNRRYNETVLLTAEALKKFPEDFTLNLIRGLTLAQNEKFTDAKINLKKAIDLNPNDINALSAYGYTLNQLKFTKESIYYTKKAVQLDPNNVSLLGTLGSIYDGQKMYNECDSIYEKALSIEKNNPLINNNYAYSLSERGTKLDRALEMANIAVKAEPDNSSYLDTIGWIYFKMGNFELASKNIKKSIDVGGEKAVILDHLGDVMFKSGNKKEAVRLWTKAFELDKENSEIKQKIEKGGI
jgi:tetratricopeptide (TPR) repeat protein